jgi:hypothetical protein
VLGHDVLSNATATRNELPGVQFLSYEDAVALLDRSAEGFDSLEALSPTRRRDDQRREDAEFLVPRIVHVDQMHGGPTLVTGVAGKLSATGKAHRLAQ